MKMDLHTTHASTALLRTANCVDTLETNSLCCAAAGIIAPFRATTEAFIPHEKLRGAAHVDATLNAPKRPPAQPVLGYKPLLLEHQVPSQSTVTALQIEEQTEIEKEFSVHERVQYCRQRGTYIRSPGASTSNTYAHELYAYRAGLTGWLRRSWKRAVLDTRRSVQDHLAMKTYKEEV